MLNQLKLKGGETMSRQEFQREMGKIIALTIQYTDPHLRWKKLSECINGLCEKLELE
jgi:hypothetical protein